MHTTYASCRQKNPQIFPERELNQHSSFNFLFDCVECLESDIGASRPLLFGDKRNDGQHKKLTNK